MEKIERIRDFTWENTKTLVMENIDSGTFTDALGSTYMDLPPFCRALFESSPGSGSRILTEVWLPVEWNGIFVGIGNGGIGGKLCEWDLAHYVKLGYAAATTDLGTTPGLESGIHNPDVWKDFGWRATHIMTRLGKALAYRYYGRKEDYSYFDGASTGGQQALSEAQRFPEDYDGILAGVPANNRVFLHTYFWWTHVHLTAKDGSAVLTEEEIRGVHECAVAFFQERGDGVPGDNFVSFPYADENTVEDFLAFVHRAQPQLTDEKLAVLRAVYTGPVNPVTGEQIYCGMPIGAELCHDGLIDYKGTDHWGLWPFIWAFGADYRWRDFDFAADMDRLSALMSPDLDANSADLSAFRARGGKLLVYSGSADPAVPFPDALAYYNRVAKNSGGFEKTAEFFRYYLVPGKDHNVCGPGANTLFGASGREEDPFLVLRKWREEGRAPEYLTAAKVDLSEGADKGTVLFERKVYPYRADKIPGSTSPAVCCERYLNMSAR